MISTFFLSDMNSHLNYWDSGHNWIIHFWVSKGFQIYIFMKNSQITGDGDLQGIIIITSLSFNKILLRDDFTDFLLLHISADTRPPHIWTLSWAGGSCRGSWSQSRRQGTTGNRSHPWPTGLERNFLGVRSGFRKFVDEDMFRGEWKDGWIVYDQ